MNTPPTRAPQRPWLRTAAARALAGVATLMFFVPVAAFGGAAHAEDDDPLDQTVNPNQAQGTGQVVLDSGHVDFGPTLNTGQWAVQLHDDTGVPSYWRSLTDVVLQVNDTAIKQVPEGEGYAFLGLQPGSDVWIVPQVQDPDVIWAGWNTQEPNVLDSLKRGATLSVLGVEGPGDVTVFLQNGNFGDVTVLWSSLKPFPQQSWIEVNTHTHANWVFSKPGIYLIEVQFDGDLISGQSVSARDTLRFSVGDDTDPKAAYAMSIDPHLTTEDPAGTTQDTQPPGGVEPGDGGLATLIWISVGAVVTVLVGAVVVVIITTRQAKARARAARNGQGGAE